ncbi:MAG: adenylate/guanylate cyclase domain-containing protein [Sulfuricellaceae bacterium]|nr:adenylate/guanylate cyclase domain-containing protein [Sulfuricellaceae bacterium]
MAEGLLFNREEGVISAGEKLLAEGGVEVDHQMLFDAHAHLLKEYKKLFTQTKRLVRMDDRHQGELSKKTKELHLRNEFIKKTFGRYMSDEVVEKLLDSQDGLNLGGQSLTVTVMFSDLRGFSAISEALAPETVVEMLNDYLKVMTHIIFKYSGTINEIMGDGILMLFGAPNMRLDDSDRAIACAIEMQLAMEKVNINNREKGLPELEMGIGINTGKVIAGNVGSDMRVKYAAVGSNVNLAARVESFTVGGQILVTESTLKALSSEVKVGSELVVPFKGIKKPVTIYEITGILGPYQQILPEKLVSYRTLTQALEIDFEMLDGKQASGDVQKGRITHLAGKSALLLSPVALPALSNLKFYPSSFGVQIEQDPAYAKVLKSQNEGCYEIYFTFVPAEIRSSLDQLFAQAFIDPDVNP